MTTPMGTPTSSPILESWFLLAGGGDAVFVGAMTEAFDLV